MKLIPAHAAAARARAAMAYSGLEISEISELTGITVGTLRNIRSNTRPRGGRLERLFAIADATGVPREFMEHGWDAIHHDRREAAGASSQHQRSPNGPPARRE
jgi:transcriptional regulator with XRE-family HTH domain